ncbi:hypothetical protein SAMN05421503_2258 [Terribacillus aidingensis]|uniref:Uncharacterized protein n=1 Tax=Terribacillus aidingensis TaxID=586416 RepID=A0A285NXI0_9BACI|nr:hypothetical protein [Terribacillus aidingensis]SNZ14190.1 hypothetical protein SAMN05421503_2258 [Terribacillus aidingensis]
MLLFLFGFFIVAIITVLTPKHLFHYHEEISAAATQQAKTEAANYLNANRDNHVNH